MRPARRRRSRRTRQDRRLARRHLAFKLPSPWHVGSILSLHGSNEFMENTMTVLKKIPAAAIAACLSAVIVAPGANAAEITIVSSPNVQPALDAIIPLFEHASGHTIAITYKSTPGWPRHIDAGPPVDLAVAYTDTLDRLVSTGKVASGLRRDILRSGIGVAVRAGAPKPDISSVEALKNTLLSAKSVAFSKGP